MKPKDWFTETFTYLLALLFCYTALSKMVDFGRFNWEISNQPFAHWLRPIIIYGLPVIELVTTFLILRIKTRQIGFYCSAVLMFVFTIYVSLVTFHYYNRIPCSCAGVFHAMSWPQHLIFNIIFMAMAILGILLNSNQSQGQNSNHKSIAH